MNNVIAPKYTFPSGLTTKVTRRGDRARVALLELAAEQHAVVVEHMMNGRHDLANAVEVIDMHTSRKADRLEIAPGVQALTGPGLVKIIATTLQQCSGWALANPSIIGQAMVMATFLTARAGRENKRKADAAKEAAEIQRAAKDEWKGASAILEGFEWEEKTGPAPLPERLVTQEEGQAQLPIVLKGRSTGPSLSMAEFANYGNLRRSGMLPSKDDE
jgi:hypothetical protein